MNTEIVLLAVPAEMLLEAGICEGNSMQMYVDGRKLVIENLDDTADVVCEGDCEDCPVGNTDCDGACDTATEPEQTEQNRNLAPILEQNSECIGWICIEGTAVNYPVMHTPTDPQKYLRKDFYGKYSVSGVPFLDCRCTLDINLIVYGHNMKNGTMFADLKKYLDKDFRAQHHVIEFETAAGVRYFTVTEVIKTDIYDKRYEDIELNGKQKLILSTCYGSAKSGRLLIVAEESE